MAKANNKCPKCGGMLRLTADISCTIRIHPDGKREVITPPKLLAREVITVAGYGYPYRADCVCEKCGEKLIASISQDGVVVASTEHDF